MACLNCCSIASRPPAKPAADSMKKSSVLSKSGCAVASHESAGRSLSSSLPWPRNGSVSAVPCGTEPSKYHAVLVGVDGDDDGLLEDLLEVLGDARRRVSRVVLAAARGEFMKKSPSLSSDASSMAFPCSSSESDSG